MRRIRAVVADDEEVLRNYLRKKLSNSWPELIVAGEAGDGESALRLLRDLKPDIAFLDIRMPGMSGIDVARKAGNECLIVFVTAYDKYAVEAFENAAIDYVLKPLTDERIEKTVARLKERLSSASMPDLSQALEKAARAMQQSSGRLQWIKAQHKDDIRLIPVAEIFYFKATDRYTTVRTEDGEFLIRKSIKELEEELDPGQFWRVHRATIVNARAISAVNRSVAGTSVIRFKKIPDRLTVSRAYAHLFKQM